MWYTLLQSAGAESLGLFFQYTCAKRKVSITRVKDKDRERGCHFWEPRILGDGGGEGSGTGGGVGSSRPRSTFPWRKAGRMVHICRAVGGEAGR